MAARERPVVSPAELFFGDGRLPPAFAVGTVQYLTWTAAALLEWATPFVVDDSGFEVEPIHFVERHRVVVLVAIGESVVAAGYRASRHPLGFALGTCALLGLATSGSLWWAYFGRDDGSVEGAVEATPARRRPHRVLVAFGIWHLPLLLGVIIEASGLRLAVEAPLATLSTGAAVALAAGISVYLLGEALFQEQSRAGRAMAAPGCLRARVRRHPAGYDRLGDRRGRRRCRPAGRRAGR